MIFDVALARSGTTHDQQSHGVQSCCYARWGCGTAAAHVALIFSMSTCPVQFREGSTRSLWILDLSSRIGYSNGHVGSGLNQKCIQYTIAGSPSIVGQFCCTKEVSPKEIILSHLATGSIAYLYFPSSNGFSTYSSSSSSSSSCARPGCDSSFTSDTGRLGSRPILPATEK